MTFHNTKWLQIVSFHVIMRVSNLEGKKKLFKFYNLIFKPKNAEPHKVTLTAKIN